LTLAVNTVVVAASTGAAHDPIPAGQYVELAVSDTGSGMSPDIMAHIFEPFFTTKDVGKGTGLGLAMVYGTVKQSGGFIDVESEVGRGTTFRLRFPPSHAGESRVGRQTTPDASTSSAEATVLIVEDENAVRNLVLVALAQRGYRLLSAATAQEALDLVDAEARPVDLLLTDANMPGMNGVELVSRLVAKWPALPVILMSGFTEDLESLAGLEDQMTLLPKPFTPRQLREHVDRMLAHRR
jgi:two-component system cell cycle sensor histidine kinase/response regulator CckA